MTSQTIETGTDSDGLVRIGTGTQGDPFRRVSPSAARQWQALQDAGASEEERRAIRTAAKPKMIWTSEGFVPDGTPLKQIRFGNVTSMVPDRSVSTPKPDAPPVVDDRTPSGLREFLSDAADKNEKAERDFTLLAGRLARGEDVDAKKIAAICKAAGRTNDDLKSEFQEAGKHVAYVATIEAARVKYSNAGSAYQNMAEARLGHLAAEARIKAEAVDLEVARFDLMARKDDLRREINAATEAAASARGQLVAVAEKYGFDLPDDLQASPNPPWGFMPLRVDWGDAIVFAVEERLRLRRLGQTLRPVPSIAPVAVSQPDPAPEVTQAATASAPAKPSAEVDDDVDPILDPSALAAM